MFHHGHDFIIAVKGLIIVVVVNRYRGRKSFITVKKMISGWEICHHRDDFISRSKKFHQGGILIAR